MNTERTRIRPRVRGAETVPRTMPPPAEPLAQQAIASEEPTGLPLLARLPEVSPPSNRARLSEQLDWLKKLDWNRLRQINLDPNWVAGGVLALVLVLLLVITLNRSPKPAPSTAAEAEAPAWNGGKSAAAPTTLAATPGVAASPTGIAPGSANNSAAPAPAAGSVGPVQGGIQQGPSYATQPVTSAEPNASLQGQFSLEGVFYPRTPHAAPAGLATHPIDHAVNQPAASSVYGRELRTAQRDIVSPHHSPMQPAVPQAGRAQLEGIISQP
jgi:hypothetical protein